jgi:hypothetical protein
MPAMVRCAPAGIAALLLLAQTVCAGTAAAFCRVTTCNRDEQPCATDGNQTASCVTEGVPLAWRRPKISFVVDGRGSELRGVSGEQLLEAAALAAQAWSRTQCGDSSLGLGEIELQSGSGMAGFEAGGDNQNVIHFVDAGWNHGPQALAKTTLGIDLDSGEILDADIAVNSQNYEFTLEPDLKLVDLVAVLTHEMGHALGLDHSQVPQATMRPETRGFATSELRDLQPDDALGLCAAYPPSAGDEVPVEPVPSCALLRVGTARRDCPWAAVGVVVLVFAARRHSHGLRRSFTKVT